MKNKNKVNQLNKHQHIVKRINQTLLKMNKPGIEINTTLFDNDVLKLCELDSLGFMEFISAIEEEFEIEFRDDIEFEQLNNISSLLKEINDLQCSH